MGEGHLAFLAFPTPTLPFQRAAVPALLRSTICSSSPPVRKRPLMESSRVVQSNRMISQAGKRKDLRGILTTLSDLEASRYDQPNVYTLNAVINACILCGVGQDVLQEMWDRVIASGVTPNTISYNTKLKACLRPAGGGLAAGLKLLAEMRSAGLRPDVFTFNGLINLCVKEGELGHAQIMVEGMKNAGLTPDIYTASILIRAYGLARDLDKAMEIWESLQASGIQPTHHTYNSLAEACLASGKVDKAIELLNESRDLTGPTTFDTNSYNLLLKALREGGGPVQDSFDVMEEMSGRQVRPDSITFNTLVHTCCKQGDLAAAMRALELTKQYTKPPTAIAYNHIITAVTEALDGELMAALCTPEWNRLLDALFGQRYGRKALGVYQQMEKHGHPDEETYSMVVMALCQDGKLGDSVAALERAQGRGVTLPLRACTEVAQSLLEVSDMVHLQKLLVLLENAGVQPDQVGLQRDSVLRLLGGQLRGYTGSLSQRLIKAIAKQEHRDES